MENENILIMKDLDVRLFTDRGELPVIDRLSLTLKAGETLGIVGESGCGKSMLASAIMGLVAHPGKVTGGSIQFEGQELVGMKGSAQNPGNRYLHDLPGANDQLKPADDLRTPDCGDHYLP